MTKRWRVEWLAFTVVLWFFLATVDDSVQFTSKKKCDCFCHRLEEAKIQDGLFWSCRHSPAIRTFLTNLFSEIYEVLSLYSALSETDL